MITLRKLNGEALCMPNQKTKQNTHTNMDTFNTNKMSFVCDACVCPCFITIWKELVV